MGYLLYVRKSQEDEGRQVQSIGDQIKKGTALAEALGLDVVELLEESKSAKRPGRPVFNEMIARIESGEVDGIIAWHPDRLARNAVDAGIIIDLLDRGKLQDLKFDSYKFENTPEGKWMLNIVLSQSKYFVDKLAKDVKRGMQSKLEKGHFPFHALPGYVNNRVERTIEADPERFAMVQQAMKLVLTRAYSAPEALGILNDQWGFRTRKTTKRGGQPLARTSFYDMLSNVFYTGMMKCDGQLYQGKHPAMLTQQEFDDLQRILGRGKPVQRQQIEFDFTGLMKCGLCGCGVTAERKIKHYKVTNRTCTYVYYHCTNSRGGCSKQSVTQEQVEQQLAGLLAKVTIHPKVVQWCLGPGQRWFEQESGFNHDTLDALLRALSVAERKKSNLLNDRFTNPGTLTAQEFKEQKELYQTDINELQKEIKKAQEELETVRRTVENVFDFAVNAKYNFEQGSPKLRKEVAANLGVNYLLTLGKLGFEPHPLLVPIMQIEPAKKGFQSEECNPFESMVPVWWAIPDEVRNLAIRLGSSFPKVVWPSPLTVPLDNSLSPVDGQ